MKNHIEILRAKKSLACKFGPWVWSVKNQQFGKGVIEMLKLCGVFGFEPITKSSIKSACAFVVKKGELTIPADATFCGRRTISGNYKKPKGVIPYRSRVQHSVWSKPKSTPPIGKQEKEKFFLSWEWCELRYETLKQYGRRCMCCGSTPECGVSIQVDHIEPISVNWHRRLDPTNLQVLCNLCNRGKSNKSQEDYRDAA